MSQAIVERVNHVLVRVNHPDRLFSTLTEHLLLPPAWPVTTNPFYASGGIHLGNANLELIRLVGQREPARLFGIAFQLAPYETSLRELAHRGIPHTPPQPFYLVDEQGWQITAWNNVYLGGLMGDSPISRLFFRFSHRVPAKAWESGTFPTQFNRRFRLPFIYNQVYRDGITFSVDYNPTWRSASIREENTQVGLGIKGIFEITVGIRQYQQAYPCWQALLEPHTEVAEGVWQLPDNLHIRLVPHKRDGLLGMIWQVHSLNRAVQFLHRRSMLGAETDGMFAIAQEKIGGLDIRLVQ